ncbi:uncharacterized protein M421DRAFT_195540 [Didymella exigua CBS 183.55]|uniref:Uncharacterized protein n=1 Tax=Didymella exigua CBS 183.55 TaxID=1150837 RepID=A0A6A5S250_9PLEO|nr:uncharacterized protein M421DRAFT_195540 [Didymella exigua CBS 183.55]KAF1933378.1 hypothetical protein M421DRAFT_195540 [Didymella exigua CBS 183.55]
MLLWEMDASLILFCSRELQRRTNDGIFNASTCTPVKQKLHHLCSSPPCSRTWCNFGLQLPRIQLQVVVFRTFIDSHPRSSEIATTPDLPQFAAFESQDGRLVSAPALSRASSRGMEDIAAPCFTAQYNSAICVCVRICASRQPKAEHTQIARASS